MAPKTIAVGDRTLTAGEVAELLALCDRYRNALMGVATMAECVAARLPPSSDVPRALALGPLLTLQGLADSALERE